MDIDEAWEKKLTFCTKRIFILSFIIRHDTSLQIYPPNTFKIDIYIYIYTHFPFYLRETNDYSDRGYENRDSFRFNDSF